eukprot:g3064.t1
MYSPLHSEFLMAFWHRSVASCELINFVAFSFVTIENFADAKPPGFQPMCVLTLSIAGLGRRSTPCFEMSHRHCEAAARLFNLRSSPKNENAIFLSTQKWLLGAPIGKPIFLPKAAPLGHRSGA